MSMLSTHSFTHLAVSSFEKVSDWKSSFIKLRLSDRLIRLLRMTSLAHCTTKLLFSLAQQQNLLALGNWTRVFSCPNNYNCYQFNF